MRRVLKLFLVITLSPALANTAAKGQGQVAAPTVATPSPSPSTTPTATPTPTPIPLAEVVTQAESAAASLRDTEADLSSDQIITGIETELSAVTREIDARLAEDSRALSPSPSLETLRALEAGWQKIDDNLTAWERDLRASASRLERQIGELGRRADTWEQTLALARGEGGTPPEVLQRIEAVIAATRQARAAVERRRAQALALQNRVVGQSARVKEALASISQAREVAVNRLFIRDSPPVWSGQVRSRAGQNLIVEGRSSFGEQLTALGAYAGRHAGSFFLHAVLIILLVAALYWVRRRVKPWVGEEPSVKHAALVFERPVAAAFVLSILAGGWIYPLAPRLWGAVLGAVALIPTIIILRGLVEPRLYPVLNALVVFNFVDLLRTAGASLPITSRFLFLFEMLAGILFLAWFVKSARSSPPPEAEGGRLWKTVRVAAGVTLAGFVVAFVAGTLGYVSLATLVGNALLGSAYLAVILYAAARIADGLMMFALRVRPLNLLGMVRENRPLFRRRVRGALRALAFFIWLLMTLERLSLRRPLFGLIRDVLTARLVVGSLEISLGNVLAFAVTVWAAFLLSKFVRFVLEEDVYPRLTLARGVPYAVSTMLNYAILVVGFFLAVAAMGIDMTRFTILAGAFGVGLGFGLQNIFNNFVSGLIVLFERPVKVGDSIQMSEASGIVKRIGIRASVISAWNGSDIIVPNGKLISESVTNWTLLSGRRGVAIPVRVAHGTDPGRVIELLKGVAGSHELVAADPEPEALMVDFGPDSLNFELRAWTYHNKEWEQVRSDLAVAVNSVFAAEGISMPYPQRDLHLRSIDTEALGHIIKPDSAQSNRATASVRTPHGEATESPSTE